MCVKCTTDLSISVLHGAISHFLMEQAAREGHCSNMLTPGEASTKGGNSSLDAFSLCLSKAQYLFRF